MADGARPVPRDSAAYREFARLYRLAQSLRPTGVDRWNGELYSTDGDNWGGFSPKTGRISMSGELVLRHLTGPGRPTAPERQAQALATVLHEATHAGMPTDAPDEPNAVRSEHSVGLMEGVAEARALADFPVFAGRAGYPGLDLPEPKYPAAHAAAADLMRQASGPRKGREELIADAARGPAVMHFDQLADGVLRNRLHDVVPDRAEDRLAVRAALIETMTHQGWLVLKDLDSTGTGLEVARNIRQGLDAKVDEIRQHYRAQPRLPFSAESPNRQREPSAERPVVAASNRWQDLPAPDATQRVDRPEPGVAAPDAQDSRDAVEGMRFLDGVAPAAGATAERPSLGQGARGAGRRGLSGPARPAERGKGSGDW